MKRDDLPADDQIVRYVKPSMIQDDGTADGSDFRLRASRPDEAGLSVNWLGVDLELILGILYKRSISFNL